MAGWRPLRRHRADELTSGLHFAVRYRDIVRPNGELLGAAYFIAEVQGFERERLLQRPHRDEVRLGAKDEAPDPDHACFLESLEQQDVRLLGSHPASGRDVIALLVEDGVDLRQI